MLLGTISKVYLLGGGEFKLKAYVCCFYDNILLFKSVQRGGVSEITKFGRTYFIDGPLYVICLINIY